jgi:Arc/MetJ-type ribon-helix-helix transcriptional regulator
MSVTFTVRIPRKLAEKMKKYSEINWSEVVRKSIEEYLERLEEARTVVPASELLEELQEEGLDPALLEPLSVEKELELYRKVGEAEWKRLSTIRAR